MYNTKFKLIILLGFFTALTSQAQTHHISAEISYGIDIPLGPGYNVSDQVKTVSLFQNFNPGKTGSLQISWNSSVIYSFGIIYESLGFYSWNEPNYNQFEGSSMKLNLTGALMRIKFKGINFPRKQFFSVQIAPLLGKYSIELESPPYEVVHGSNPAIIPLSEAGMTGGISTDLIASLPVFESLILSFKTRIRYIHISSKLCTDRNLFSIAPELTISYNFIMRKTRYIF